ncbi:MAG TPA: alpha/beta hydrolase [Burkholderiales bacterium]
MEILFSAGKIALGVAIGLPLLAYLLQDRILFHPRPLSDEQRAEARKGFRATEEILIQAKDGTRLQAWHVDAGAGAPLVLYFGGNAEDVSWMIGDAAQKAPGVSWLLVSYRGYGGSEGSPSEASLISDALEWHDYAVKALKPARVFAFGRSLGSGVAVYLAAERPLAGVVLVTPYDSLVEVAKRIYPYLPVGLLMKNRFESIRLAPKMTVPLLCLAAERDEIIPPEHARRLYEAWVGPKQWVALPGAGHNSTDGVPDFWRSIRPFLEGRHGPA